MANCSQTNNTTIIGTSAVSYDSTQLPCTNVKACDDLNTILTKFDNVICSATNSVNILIEEVMNITEEVMIITEEIENINSQIFICCPICEFTGTADELPVCDFTGSADQLPTPTTTTTTTTIPPTTTTTSSSTSTSSTTTTTTTVCPCTYINITITPGYIVFSDTGSVQVTYTNCQGLPDSITYTVKGTYAICSPDINSIQGSYVRLGETLTVPLFPFNTGTLCCIPTTTTSTTTEVPISCQSYSLNTLTEDSIGFFYNVCLGGPDYILVPGYSTVIVCADGSPSTSAPEYKATIGFEGPC